MAHPVVHWEITGKDGKRLQEFYARLFGWTINDNNPMKYGLVETGGTGGINGGIGQTCPGGQSYLAVYVQVDDLQAMLDKAASLGGKMVIPPTPVPNVGAIAMFQDPEGHCVGLFKK
jgi:predicted enzyme related to lactoylglutathione lyase